MNKTWLITGASSGLGRTMSEKLLARGDRVVATVRRKEALDELAQSHRERLHVAVLDVTDTGAVNRTIADAFEAMGRIDVIVSNAGYGLFGAAEEVTDTQIDRQIATNLVGSIRVIRASLPHLRAQGGGRIMQVSSEGGQVAYPNFSLYHATKWGIEGFVEAVAQEVAPFGIDFVLVEPGPTSTNFAARLDRADALPIYDATPSGDIRRALASGGFVVKGDARRSVDAMIAAGDAARPALRLALGSTAYENIETALKRRLDAIRSQKAEALGADAPIAVETVR
ncbi:SDR family oxidoreductase [Aurantimonas endophytica]|uniref:NAD(P)-dependent dehydrogenase (Short-subunit alcohol dehydrogenase family) n=1 Tax=Aurantimonas endophytica TaxID=1522175 RepID=A0A7W6HCR6_9HYPH|nr:SDR family oxidoreductase [Aurantimonas endophytica]MBB4002768.1 NAD(P)-dependent dehydrogenase (short-subunit alcohol dehydrogenase family) [Aurantimonas endophytica]MCO6403646.1 SDR family oxidoreductase [Aurantimonas endophytica]